MDSPLDDFSKWFVHTLTDGHGVIGDKEMRLMREAFEGGGSRQIEKDAKLIEDTITRIGLAINKWDQNPKNVYYYGKKGECYPPRLRMPYGRDFAKLIRKQGKK